MKSFLRPKRWKQALSLLWKGSLAGILVAVVFLSLCPFLLSTSWGKKTGITVVEWFIPGKITIDSLSLSWFRGQQVEGFHFRDEKNGVFVEFDQLKTEASLIDLLFRRMMVGETRLDSPKIVLNSSERPSASSSPSSKKKPSTLAHSSSFSPSFRLPLVGHVILNKGSFSLLQQGKAEVAIEGIEMEVTASDAQDSLFCHVEAKTRQGDLQGNVRAGLTFMGFDEDGQFHFREKAGLLAPLHDSSCHFHLEINQLPTDGIDQMITMSHAPTHGLIQAIVGDKMNLFADLQMDSNEMVTALKVFSPSAKLSLKGHCKEGSLLLTEGASRLTVSPESWSALQRVCPVLAQWSLQEKSDVEVNCERFALPLFSFGNAPDEMIKAASLALHFSLSPTKWLHAHRDPLLPSILLDQCEGLISSYPEEEECLLSCKMEMANGEQQSTQLNLQGSFSHFFNQQRAFSLDQLAGECSCTLSHFPLRVADYALQTEHWFSDLLGEDLQAKVESRFHAGQVDVNAALKADYIAVEEMAFSIGKESMTVNTPFVVQYHLPKKVLNRELERGMVSDNKQIRQLRFLKDFAFEWQIDRCTLPFSLNDTTPFYLSDNIVLQSQLSMQPIDIQNVAYANRVVVDHLKLELEADSLQDIKLKGKGGVLGDDKGVLGIALGEKTTAFINGQGFFNRQGEFAVPHLFCQLESEKLNWKGTLQCLDGQNITCIHPMTFHYILSPECLSLFGPRAAPLKNITLLNALPFSFEIEEGTFPLSFKDHIDAFQCRAKLQAQEINVKTESHLVPYPSLKQFYCDVNVDGQKKIAAFSCNSHLFSSPTQHAGLVDAKVNVSQWFKEKQLNFAFSRADGHITLDQISIPFIEAFFDASAEITPFLGSLLRCQANFRLNDASNWLEMDLEAFSDHFETKGGYAIDKQWNLSTTKPHLFDWSMTPVAFRRLFEKMQNQSVSQKRPKEIELSEPARIALNVDSLSLPLSLHSSPLALFNALTCKATASLSNCSITDKQARATLLLSDWSEQFSKQRGENGVMQTHFQGKCLSKEASMSSWKEGRVDCKMKASLFGDKGEIDWNRGKLHCQLQGSSLPIAWFSRLACLSDKKCQEVEALLGQECELGLECAVEEKQGKVQWVFDSPHAKCKLDGRVSEGMLFLNKPMEVNLWANAQWNSAFFHAPFLLEDQFIRLTAVVSPEKTGIPLFDFDLQRVNVGETQVDLGQWRILSQKNSVFSQLLALVHQQQEGLFTNGWFAPCCVVVENGVLDLKRLDVLLNDSIHLIAWGKTSLLNQHINMTSGITSESLKQIVGESSDIPPNTILEIPIKGTWQKPEINWKKASKAMAFFKGTELGKKQLKKQDDVIVQNILGFAFSLVDKKAGKYFRPLEEVPQQLFSLPWKKR